jgi:Kdo2-lipid IVA lauroyltransferase/acyltransferase
VLSIYKLVKFIFRHVIPDALRYPAARGLARLVCLCDRRRRRVLIQNLTPIVGPAKAPALAPRLLGHFSMTAVDFFCPRRNLARDIHEENASVIEKAYRRSKKVIVLTAHLGNWELGMSYLMEKGFSMAGVYAPYREDEVVSWIMRHRNPDVEWIPAARGAAQACVNALERGRLLGMVADVPYGEKGRRARISGAWTRLPLGPWAIASRARATVIPGFVLRERPGQYRIVFHDPILPREGTFRKQIEETQEIYRQHLEHYLTTYPEQWGVLQPFWELRGHAIEADPPMK